MSSGWPQMAVVVSEQRATSNAGSAAVTAVALEAGVAESGWRGRSAKSAETQWVLQTV